MEQRFRDCPTVPCADLDPVLPLVFCCSEPRALRYRHLAGLGQWTRTHTGTHASTDRHRRLLISAGTGGSPFFAAVKCKWLYARLDAASEANGEGTPARSGWIAISLVVPVF